MEKYIKTNKENHEIKVQVKYNKGGMSYATYKHEARGYYLHVQPVNVERRNDGIVVESYAAFSGYKMLLNEIKRDSNKAYNEAVAKAEIELPKLLERVCSEQNYETL